MKTIFKIIALSAILLILAGGLASCEKKEKCMPFVIVAQGSLVGGEGILQQNLVIRTQEEWENFITTFPDSFSETEIDFSTHIVIAVIDEVRPTGGWGIGIGCITEVSSAEESFGRVVVVPVIINKPHGRVTLAVTQPYIVIKIPTPIKNIEFKHIIK